MCCKLPQTLNSFHLIIVTNPELKEELEGQINQRLWAVKAWFLFQVSANIVLKFIAWVMLCFLCLQLHNNCTAGTTAYQTCLQAIQNQNKLIDFSDYISYSYVSYLHFWNYPRPPFLLTELAHLAVSCSGTKAANFYQEPKQRERRKVHR